MAANPPPPDNNWDWLNDELLNGDTYRDVETGEIEEVRVERIVHFLNTDPQAAAPFEHTTFDKTQTRDFLKRQVASLRANIPQADATDKSIVALAWLRFFAARTGLVSPKFSPGDYHVKYNEAVVSNATDAININIRNVMPAAEVNRLRKNFSNIVCAVAFMFRVRGHHYLDDMKDRYHSLWRKCLQNDDYPFAKWEHIAHHGLHAIFPIVLDNFWFNMTQKGNIAGALGKRYNSSPAGVAAFRAVHVGATDLAICMPGIKFRLKDTYANLAKIIAELQANRWTGSINRKYYGATPLSYDEGEFAAIAATIIAALQAFMPTSPLLKSAALNRVASNAPLTGGILSRTIQQAATDPENAKKLLVPTG